MYLESSSLTAYLDVVYRSSPILRPPVHRMALIGKEFGKDVG